MRNGVDGIQGRIVRGKNGGDGEKMMMGRDGYKVI